MVRAQNIGPYGLVFNFCRDEGRDLFLVAGAPVIKKSIEIGPNKRRGFLQKILPTHFTDSEV
jgi:hypothetical protein